MCVFITGTNVWWVCSSGGRAACSERWPLGAAVLLMDDTVCTYRKCGPASPPASHMLGLFGSESWTIGCNAGTDVFLRQRQKPIFLYIFTLPYISQVSRSYKTHLIKYIFGLRCKNHALSSPLGFQEKIHVWASRWKLHSGGKPVCFAVLWYFFYHCRNPVVHVRANYTRLRKRKCQRANHIWWSAAGCQRVLYGPAIVGGCFHLMAGRIPPDNHILVHCVMVCEN